MGSIPDVTGLLYDDAGLHSATMSIKRPKYKTLGQLLTAELSKGEETETAELMQKLRTVRQKKYRIRLSRYVRFSVPIPAVEGSRFAANTLLVQQRGRDTRSLR